MNMRAHVEATKAKLIAEGALDQALRETGWTATRTRVAMALYNCGLSAREVAGEIGGVSRNGVIGKIHRDGMSEADRKESRAAGQVRAQQRRSSSAPSARGPVARLKEPPKEASLPPNIIDQQIPIEQRRTLAQLNDACCHWPVGDPQAADFFFCGAVKDNDRGVPYCAAHVLRSQHRDGARRKPRNDAAFANFGPNAIWR